MNRLAFLFTSACVVSCASSTPTPSASSAVGETPAEETPAKTPQPVPLGQLDRAVIPRAYRLELSLIPDAEDFSGIVEIDVDFAEPTDRFFLHGLDLEVHEVTVTQGDALTSASYRQVDPTGVAELTVSSTLDAGAGTLRFVYSAAFNRKLQGIYRVDDGGDAYAFSQFEAISARLAFPSFDEPAFKTPFDITVTTSADNRVISTTPEVSADTLADGQIRHRFAKTQPLPTYLIAFAVGPLDIVEYESIGATAVRDRPIPLRGVAARGKGERLNYALKDTAQLVTTLEEYFGTPYPYAKLDIIAAPDFAFGAMENVGAIIYREERLLLDANSPLEQRRKYLLTHSHELAHQWFGNLVTPKWWTDIWLNESFASWMGNRAVATARPKQLFDRTMLDLAIKTMKADALVSARKIREPIARNLEIWSAFDSITYRKGGGILSMFENYLGDEAFRAGVRTHMKRFAHSVADADDFSESLAQGSKRAEVVPAFRSFIEQPGVPLLTMASQCNEGKASLAITQSRYRPLGSEIDPDQTWGVPLCFGVWSADNKREDRCELLDAKETTVALDTCPRAILPNVGGAGYYHFTFAENGFDELLARFPKLSEAEQLATYSSLEAAFRSGEIDLRKMMKAVRLAAASGAWDVQLAPIPLLEELGRIKRIEPLPGLASVNRIYGAKTLRTGARQKRNENEAAALVREELLRMVALWGREPKLRRLLMTIAEGAVLGESQPTESQATAVALAVRAQETGEAFFKEAMARLKVERDGYARSELTFGLAYLPAAQLDALFSVMLTDTFRVNESIALIQNLFEHPSHGPLVMAWMIENFDALMARLPSQFQGRIFGNAKTLCGPQATEQLTKLAALAQSVQGGERALAQATEAVELCMALASHARGAKPTTARVE